jgi:dolichyl-diphosphooligosaccharide--protein glycosyltransferase/undecaprenyl-diphosphooligosaccharide--protein glycosyltransferase
VGYALLVRKHPVMLLGLPMLGLGLLAYVGGLRFTIYAVPIAAFGMGYLIVWCVGHFERVFARERNVGRMGAVLLVAATALVLHPNIAHVLKYRVPTVLNAHEVAQLEAFGTQAQREDYVVAWWDYGYPLRYYADVRTLSDGGKHQGAVNFPISYAMLAPQNEAAALATLDVAFTEARIEVSEENRTLPRDERKELPASNMAWMMETYDYADANDFLAALPALPKPTLAQTVYMYLPYRMTALMPTIGKFSTLDIMDGSSSPMPFFFFTRHFQDTSEMLHLNQSISLEKANGTVHINDQRVPLARMVTTRYDEKGTLVREVQSLQEGAQLSLIYMAPYRAFLLVDEAMYQSTFVQLFVLEAYDARYFTPISQMPWAKIYKIQP